MEFKIEQERLEEIVRQEVKKYIEHNSIQTIIINSAVSTIRKAVDVQDLRAWIVEQVKLKISEMVESSQHKMEFAIERQIESLVSNFSSSSILNMVKTAINSKLEQHDFKVEQILTEEIKNNPKTLTYIKEQIDRSLTSRIQNVAKNINDKFTTKMINEFLSDYFEKQQDKK